MPEHLILRLGLALVIGLLVGLERGWRERDEPEGSRTAGFRTYGLSGFLGGILAAVSGALDGGVILAAGFLAFAGVFAWFQARELERDEEYSVTSVVAALGVFALGALAVAGDYRAAAAGGVALAGVLASREALHGLLRRISWVELRSTLLLAGMTAIGLSLLPNRTIDPWGGVNPWEIWFFTVLTAAISYAGYIAIRILGPGKGVLISGLAGAIVSSTAVTVAFARRRIRRPGAAASRRRDPCGHGLRPPRPRHRLARETGRRACHRCAGRGGGADLRRGRLSASLSADRRAGSGNQARQSVRPAAAPSLRGELCRGCRGELRAD